MDNIRLITGIFAGNGLDRIGFIPFSEADVTRRYLLGETDAKTCICFLIPYRTKNNHPKLISKYSAVRDYHLYAAGLFSVLIPELKSAFPGYTFLGFADHSPINERSAAAKAGLGVFGMNHMLINDKYGSYVFIASVITDLPIECTSREAENCCMCGECVRACPTGCLRDSNFEICLSAVTQKKVRDAADFALMAENKSVWGCDVCQDVCPMNLAAEYSSLPFFDEFIINEITSDEVKNMSDKEFSERAFSWRGRNVIYENLVVYEEKNISK